MPTSEHSDAIWKRIREIVESRPIDTEVAISLYRFGTGDSLSMDGEFDFPSASTIKILVLVGLVRTFDEGRLQPDEKRTAPQELRLVGSGVLNWLDVDLELALRDHAWLMTRS